MFKVGLILLNAMIPTDAHRSIFSSSEPYLKDTKIFNEKMGFLRMTYSKNLVNIVESCLEFGPLDRFASISDLMDEVTRQGNRILNKKEVLRQKMVQNGNITSIGFTLSLDNN